jgi:hypothetical protein
MMMIMVMVTMLMPFRGVVKSKPNNFSSRPSSHFIACFSSTQSRKKFSNQKHKRRRRIEGAKCQPAVSVTVVLAKRGVV